jgi:molybdopterin molybdotransferase
MISVSEALQIVEQTSQLSATVTLKLADVQCHVLSFDIHSPIDFPPFDQSAMDGYAISENSSTEFIQKGIIQAGQDASEITINKGETYRIFTGGMVPSSAWAVVRQEDAVVNNNHISFTTFPNKGANIRPLGESVKKESVVLKKGTLLNAAAIGLLASLGIERVEVYKKPTVAIVSTGDELVPLGGELTKGKIYESNAIMLNKALSEKGFEVVFVQHTVDTEEATFTCLTNALKKVDFLVITGGVSVGDYDFVARSLLKMGVVQHFHKVKQKPGKPLFYGSLENKKIFALPGNPAAALTLFYVYILPALHFAMGKGFIGLRKMKLSSLSTVSKAEPRAQFLKAIADENKGTVELLGGQSSAMLQTFAFANAFVYLNENELVDVGSLVDVWLI